MQTTFYIGCSGFYNQHWKGVFYPEDLPQAEWLHFYAQHFNSLELNVTFYRFPSLRTMQNWNSKSPDDLVFSVKAPKLITHTKQFVDCERLFNDLYGVCEQGLQHKLGCILFQLPPSMHYEEKKLEQILAYLDPAFCNVLEFRHASWWNKEVYQALEQKQVLFCSSSYPKLPETFITTTDTAYVRMHGNTKLFHSSYSSEELKKLQREILKKPKLKKAFVYFNNTASLAGLQNAQEMKALLEKFS